MKNKKRGVKKWRIAVFFLIVSFFAGLIAVNVTDHAEDISLGLDLQGGFEVLYEVTPIDESQEVDRDLLTDTVAAINARIDVLGVSEPNVRIEGEDRIRVQLAGVTDQQTARELLSTEARLSLRDVEDNLLLDGSDFVEGGASPNFHAETNRPIVSITLRDANQMAEVSQQVMEYDPPDNVMAIWLDYEEGDTFAEEINKEDSKIVSAPSVNRTLRTTDIMIESQTFTVEETRHLAGILNAGALPVQLDEVYSNSVGASLGERAMDLAVTAGFIGVALIFAYMLLYYRFMGIMAVITLSVYIYFVLVVFNWMNAVLTLPGIAALILGVGMAVDANIITYERIKDELRSGKSMMSAFKSGSRRSLSTILDANITTILAAGVLFYYGNSAVQGFAVMLITSILVSFITAVYGSRLLLGLWVNSRILNKKPKLFGVKESEISEL
ncbi:protein translocase subunit SecD [Alteribacter natronophilus]|uniref:protein translocase subunit SecD n=1 Tax=Alteribacter natronophilus TaxID=2583810 RepID=UPI00110D5841|nr:protein translocase subunit SecD [Alteribacter natronophilus]TMW73969.1 protein translocase subunit SecD [Alteribacter natronophilus]